MTTQQPQYSHEQARAFIVAVANQMYNGLRAPLRNHYDERRPADAPTAHALMRAFGYMPANADMWVRFCRDFAGLEVFKPKPPNPQKRRLTCYQRGEPTPLEEAEAAEPGRGLPCTQVREVGSRVYYMLR